MIYRNLKNLILDSSEEEYDSTVALIKLQVDSCSLKMGSFSNNDVSLLKSEKTMNNPIDS